MARFRKGDKVQIEGVVAFDYDAMASGVHVDIVGDNSSKAIVDHRHVKLVGPVFAPGDWVEWDAGLKQGGTLRGEVRAVAGDEFATLLWVRVDHIRRMTTVDAVLCTRLDTLPAVLNVPGGNGSWVKTASPDDPEQTWERYTVQPGDTLGALANRYGASIEKIARRNSILDVDHLEEGDTILLPALRF